MLAVLLLLSPSARAGDLPTGFTASKITFAGGPRLLAAEDELGWGVGALGGYTLPVGAYIGGDLNVLVIQDSASGGGISGSSSLRLVNLYAVGGYDFGVGEQVVLRPAAGFGVVNARARGCVSAPFVGTSCGSESDSDLGVVVGAEALYRIGKVTLGGELRGFVGNVDGGWIGFNVGAVLGPEID